MLAVFAALAAGAGLAGAAESEAGPAAVSGAEVWQQACAGCHERAEMRLITREDMRAMSPAHLGFVMTHGKMKMQAAALSREERDALVAYLAPGGEAGFAVAAEDRCTDASIDTGEVQVAHYGLDAANSRHQPGSAVGRANVVNAEVAWVFGLPATSEVRSQPVVTSDTVFAAVPSGHLFALGRESGCVKWHRDLARPIRSSLTLGEVRGEPALIFQDASAEVFAVDPYNGSTIWSASAALSDMSVGTGSIVQHEGRLFVPVSSSDVSAAMDETHECCRGHGGVVALDADTGERLWEMHTTEEATPRGRNSVGTQLWGPSGVPVWTTPAVDGEAGRIYIGTGENTSLPTTDTSDALMALDMATGEVLWTYQATADDAFNMSCSYFGESGPNCPRETPGPDHDFGGSVSTATLAGGRKVVVAGQKSGVVHVVDAKTGEPVWTRKIGIGSALGGVHWGISLGNGRIYAPNADPDYIPSDETPQPGLYTLDLETGEPLWAYRAERGCEVDMAAAEETAWPECSPRYAFSAAPVSTEELVLAGALDGKLRAFDAAGGELLWTFDTARAWDSVSGVAAHGGAIDNAGVQVAGDMIFVLSGYGAFRQMPGNALIALKVPGE